MRLQIVSDIHLEFSPDFYPEKTADYIALLGDIGYPHTDVYQKIVEKLAEDYLKVFVIPGNHEYYRKQKTYDYTKNLMSTFADKFTNVYFLDNDSIVVDDIKIIGTTLWSQIPDSLGFAITSSMNDYKQIKKYSDNKVKQSISYKDTNQWHQEAIDYLEKAIKESDKKIVILTHHSPIFDNTNKLSHAYGTDLSRFFKEPIVAWCHGHTHQSDIKIINGVTISSNQRGYPSEKTGFDPGFFIEV